MGRITHMAMCTKNNRRLARFYRIVFGWDEVWNPVQNSPFAYYIGDGYFNLNCLQIRQGGTREKQSPNLGHSRGAGVVVEGKVILPEVGINHIGFQVDDLAEANRKLASLKPAITPVASPADGRYEDQRFLDPEVNDIELNGMIGSIAHLAYHLGAIRQINQSTRGPAEGVRRRTDNEKWRSP